MNRILAGLPGVLCLMDDILVFASTQEDHDKRLTVVLSRLQLSGITLNPDKCVFSKKEIKFLGHMINKDGVSADPEKTSAILHLAPPADSSQL